MIVRKGLVKRTRVNKHVIAANLKHGTDDPPIAVQISKDPIRARGVEIRGPSKFIYAPEDPLSCGARLWIEARAKAQLQ